MTNHMMPDPRALRMPGTATAMLMPWRPPAPEPSPVLGRRPSAARRIALPHTTKEISA
jgi:hypothetical protein